MLQRKLSHGMTNLFRVRPLAGGRQHCCLCPPMHAQRCGTISPATVRPMDAAALGMLPLGVADSAAPATLPSAVPQSPFGVVHQAGRIGPYQLPLTPGGVPVLPNAIVSAPPDSRSAADRAPAPAGAPGAGPGFAGRVEAKEALMRRPQEHASVPAAPPLATPPQPSRGPRDVAPSLASSEAQPPASEQVAPGMSPRTAAPPPKKRFGVSNAYGRPVPSAASIVDAASPAGLSHVPSRAAPRSDVSPTSSPRHRTSATGGMAAQPEQVPSQPTADALTALAALGHGTTLPAERFAALPTPPAAVPGYPAAFHGMHGSPNSTLPAARARPRPGEHLDARAQDDFFATAGGPTKAEGPRSNWRPAFSAQHALDDATVPTLPPPLPYGRAESEPPLGFHAANAAYPLPSARVPPAAAAVGQFSAPSRISPAAERARIAFMQRIGGGPAVGGGPLRQYSDDPGSWHRVAEAANQLESLRHAPVSKLQLMSPGAQVQWQNIPADAPPARKQRAKRQLPDQVRTTLAVMPSRRRCLSPSHVPPALGALGPQGQDQCCTRTSGARRGRRRATVGFGCGGSATGNLGGCLSALG